MLEPIPPPPLRDLCSRLKEQIVTAFPPATYGQAVTPSDGAWTPELDDAKALHDELFGKNWMDIAPEFIFDYPAELALATNDAFVAFLPAWLMQALDGIDNPVRDHIVFQFSPMHDMVPDTTQFTLDRLATMTAEQRECLRAVLAYFAAVDGSDFTKRHAAQAIELIGRYERDLEATSGSNGSA